MWLLLPGSTQPLGEKFDQTTVYLVDVIITMAVTYSSGIRCVNAWIHVPRFLPCLTQSKLLLTVIITKRCIRWSTFQKKIQMEYLYLLLCLLKRKKCRFGISKGNFDYSISKIWIWLTMSEKFIQNNLGGSQRQFLSIDRFHLTMSVAHEFALLATPI